LASSLYFLQGTLQKIHPSPRRASALAEGFPFRWADGWCSGRFARLNRLEFGAPLQRHRRLPRALANHRRHSLHPLYGHALKLPGISLSSLHSCFLSRRVCPSRVCQFKGSFHRSCRLRRRSPTVSRLPHPLGA
jgi:hypothetical protein